MASISGKNEQLCVALFERLLDEPALRRYRGFTFLRGDPKPKYPDGYQLHVDAYFPDRRLVVEFHGRQHREPNRLMDRRPGRAEQRPRYDALERTVLVERGLTLTEMWFDEPLTEQHLRRRLLESGINVVPDQS